MVVHAAESLYWCNTTEPPYLINGASNIARVTSHNTPSIGDSFDGKPLRSGLSMTRSCIVASADLPVVPYAHKIPSCCRTASSYCVRLGRSHVGLTVRSWSTIGLHIHPGDNELLLSMD